VATVLGLYSLPGFRNIRPQLRNTPMINVIINCTVIQLVSCSLPVLSRVLGITVFELQGNFGKLYWLGNFYIVFCFNAIFAVVTGLCLVKKFTNNLREALVKALSVYCIPLAKFLSDFKDFDPFITLPDMLYENSANLLPAFLRPAAPTIQQRRRRRLHQHHYNDVDDESSGIPSSSSAESSPNSTITNNNLDDSLQQENTNCQVIDVGGDESSQSPSTLFEDTGSSSTSKISTSSTRNVVLTPIMLGASAIMMSDSQLTKGIK